MTGSKYKIAVIILVVVSLFIAYKYYSNTKKMKIEIGYHYSTSIGYALNSSSTMINDIRNDVDISMEELKEAWNRSILAVNTLSGFLPSEYDDVFLVFRMDVTDRLFDLYSHMENNGPQEQQNKLKEDLLITLEKGQAAHKYIINITKKDFNGSQFDSIMLNYYKTFKSPNKELLKELTKMLE